MEFSGPEYWSGLPSHPPGDLPDSGIKPRSPALQADSLLFVPPGKPESTRKNLLKLKTWNYNEMIGEVTLPYSQVP